MWIEWRRVAGAAAVCDSHIAHRQHKIACVCRRWVNGTARHVPILVGCRTNILWSTQIEQAMNHTRRGWVYIIHHTWTENCVSKHFNSQFVRINKFPNFRDGAVRRRRRRSFGCFLCSLHGEGAWRPFVCFDIRHKCRGHGNGCNHITVCKLIRKTTVKEKNIKWMACCAAREKREREWRMRPNEIWATQRPIDNRRYLKMCLAFTLKMTWRRRRARRRLHSNIYLIASAAHTRRPRVHAHQQHQLSTWCFSLAFVVCFLFSIVFSSKNSNNSALLHTFVSCRRRRLSVCRVAYKRW